MDKTKAEAYKIDLNEEVLLITESKVPMNEEGTAFMTYRYAFIMALEHSETSDVYQRLREYDLIKKLTSSDAYEPVAEEVSLLIDAANKYFKGVLLFGRIADKLKNK